VRVLAVTGDRRQNFGVNVNRAFRIVVVEDSETQAFKLRLLLEEQGWEVIIAGSAEPGILTRTEITAGFTLPTMSEKPVGCCSVASAACADGVPKPRSGGLKFPGPANSITAPSAPTEARSVSRRAVSAVCAVLRTVLRW